nr:nucleotide-binding alpha-beta plait domain-containing protein [Tanacetum cinerariifolium]
MLRSYVILANNMDLSLMLLYPLEDQKQKPNLGNESNPVLVLDDSCLNQQDYYYCLLVLVCEGFENVKISYLGGFWVMFEFTTKEVKKKFQSCTTISSWFSQIQQATCDFTTDGRVSWVEIEDTDDGDESDDEGEPKGVMLVDSDVEAVPDIMFEALPNANEGDAPSVRNKEMHSEDPFNIYDLLKVKKVPSADSLKYPPGFTPNDDIEDEEVQSAKRKDSTQEKDEGIQNILEDDVSSKVRKSDLKMHDKENGNSGGILCVWDTNLLFIHNATVLDYFVAVRGIWVPNGKQMLIISVYAP